MKRKSLGLFPRPWGRCHISPGLLWALNLPSTACRRKVLPPCPPPVLVPLCIPGLTHSSSWLLSPAQNCWQLPNLNICYRHQDSAPDLKKRSFLQIYFTYFCSLLDKKWQVLAAGLRLNGQKPGAAGSLSRVYPLQSPPRMTYKHFKLAECKSELIMFPGRVLSSFVPYLSEWYFCSPSHPAQSHPSHLEWWKHSEFYLLNCFLIKSLLLVPTVAAWAPQEVISHLPVTEQGMIQQTSLNPVPQTSTNLWIKEWVGKWASCWKLLTSHMGSIWYLSIHWLNQWKPHLSEIPIWWHHPSDYQHSVTSRSHRMKTRFHGWHRKSPKVRDVCYCSALFSWGCSHPINTPQYPELLTWFQFHIFTYAFPSSQMARRTPLPPLLSHLRIN